MTLQVCRSATENPREHKHLLQLVGCSRVNLGSHITDIQRNIPLAGDTMDKTFMSQVSEYTVYSETQPEERRK